jgi:hypothetical protein
VLPDDQEFDPEDDSFPTIEQMANWAGLCRYTPLEFSPLLDNIAQTTAAGTSCSPSLAMP